jgi:hypothetical protein
MSLRILNGNTGNDFPVTAGKQLGSSAVHRELPDGGRAFPGRQLAAGARGPFHRRLRGIRNLLLPFENAGEASVAEGVQLYGLKHLSEVVRFLNEPETLQPTTPVLPDSAD